VIVPFHAAATVCSSCPSCSDIGRHRALLTPAAARHQVVRLVNRSPNPSMLPPNSGRLQLTLLQSAHPARSAQSWWPHPIPVAHGWGCPGQVRPASRLQTRANGGTTRGWWGLQTCCSQALGRATPQALAMRETWTPSRLPCWRPPSFLCCRWGSASRCTPVGRGVRFYLPLQRKRLVPPPSGRR
jgi:hypothetical protein